MAPGSSGTRASPRLILLLLILLAFGLRLYHLDYQSLWRDEMDAILFARQELCQLLPLFVKPGHNGPLYYVLLHGWLRLVGDSEFSLRFLSLLCGILAVPLIYLVGHRWIGDRASLVAALLAATSPYLIWYGQEGKMYALLLLLSLASTYVYQTALRRNHLRLWAFYVLLVTISLYVHLLSVLILPFHFLLFFVTWPRYRGAWKAWMGTFVVLTLPYLPLLRWEVVLLRRPFTTGHQFYALYEILAILLSALSLNAAHGRNLWSIALFVFLLLSGLLLTVRSREAVNRTTGDQPESAGRERLILALYLFIPILGIFLISLGMPIFTDRYLITIVPAFLLLLARGVGALRATSASLAMACLGLVLVSNLYVVSLQGHTPIKSDFRFVAQYVDDSGGADLILFLIPQVRSVFDYYYEDPFDWADAPFTNRGMERAEVNEYMDEVTHGDQEVWLIVSEAELWDSRGLVQEWFRIHGTLLERRSFARVDAYLYGVDGGARGRREVYAASAGRSWNGFGGPG
jgi:mannosyltransferase